MNRTTQAMIELLWFAGRFAVEFKHSKNRLQGPGFVSHEDPDFKARAKFAWQNAKF